MLPQMMLRNVNLLMRAMGACDYQCCIVSLPNQAFAFFRRSHMEQSAITLLKVVSVQNLRFIRFPL